MTTIQEFLKTLKTAKRVFPSALRPSSLNNDTREILSKTLIDSPSNSLPITPAAQTTSSLLSSLTSHKLNSFLSDPNFDTISCFRVFNVVLLNRSHLSFNPDLHAYLTLMCRLIKSRMFSEGEVLLENLIFDQNHRYPFSDFTRWVENYCSESKIITKLLNMLLKAYSDYQMFDLAFTTFNYMVEKGVERDERTCSVHLLALTRANKVDLAFEFLHGMVGSGMEVSVYSLTIVVSGLCDIGELKMARELVAEMSRRGIKPNIITFNTLIEACGSRWDFVELDFVLRLMEQEGIPFNDTTYKLLIEGYLGCGKIEEAEKVVLEMHDEGFEVETYLFDIVINGYCRVGNINSGLALLRKLQERESSPTVDVYWSLISALCKVGEMSVVKDLVKEMQKKGGELDDVMRNTLVDGYCKVGMMDEVVELQCISTTRRSSVLESSEDFMAPGP